ncbi:hypothetical protein [Thalassospira australica]|uniref:hypothetical protein n=1 Tax=Thalassospira australica TaxID=1528106 RepID=UPI00051A6641|nr:hypothetical protein [Thalassospira australica]
MISEFRKNLLLGKFKKNVIIDVGTVLGLIAVSVAIDDLSFSFFTERVAKILFILVVMLRGTRLVSETLADEFQHNTWDLVRLSRQSAFTLVWSKLFGRTVTVWIGGTIAMLAYGIAEASWLDLTTIAVVISSFIVAGLVAHTTTFLAQLMFIYRQQAEGNDVGKMHHLGMQIVGLVVAFPLLSQAYGTGSISNVLDGVLWYGWYIDLPIFMLGATLFGIVWAVIGSVMVLRHLLAHPPSIWAWPVFLITFALTIGGLETLPYSLYYIGTLFSGGVDHIQLITLGGAALVYGLLCLEPIGPNHLAVLTDRLSRTTTTSLLRYVPRSFQTGILLSGLIAIAAIFSDISVEATDKLLLVILYLGRDVLAMYGISLWRARHGTTLSGAPVVVFILLVYFVLPLGLAQFGLEFFARLTSPIVGEGWPAILSAVIQFGFAFTLFGQQFRLFCTKQEPAQHSRLI